MTTSNIIEIFCFLDEFCKYFEPELKKRAISTKLFYIVGSLSLLSIITIVLEIAFYVYFHWFQ